MVKFDLEAIQEFYASELGKVVAANIDHSIANLWQVSDYEKIIGLGYAEPYLQKWTSHCQIHLPADQDYHLPYASHSIDKILVIHYLEYLPNANYALEEIWRVLVPGGKLLTIVPNKYSIWPYSEKDLYHNSHFFTLAEIHYLLRSSLMIPFKTTACLFGGSNLYMKMPMLAHSLENIGNKWLVPFGGMLLIESYKLSYALNDAARKPKESFQPSYI